MLTVNKISCEACSKPATKIIDNTSYCTPCADGVLLKTIKRCIDNIEGAVVTIKVMPKGVVDRAKKESEVL